MCKNPGLMAGVCKTVISKYELYGICHAGLVTTKRYPKNGTFYFTETSLLSLNIKIKLKNKVSISVTGATSHRAYVVCVR